MTLMDGRRRTSRPTTFVSSFRVLEACIPLKSAGNCMPWISGIPLQYVAGTLEYVSWWSDLVLQVQGEVY